MEIEEYPEQGATPGTDEEVTTSDNDGDGAEADPPSEDPPADPPEGEKPKEEPTEEPKPETKPEDDPLHKALKAERKTVKDLKAANTDLATRNSELQERVATLEAADMARRTADLVKEKGLSESQEKALSTLGTMEEREAMAAVMFPPQKHRSIAGKSLKDDPFNAELKAAGLDPEAQRQIMEEIYKNRNSQHNFESMHPDDQAPFVIRQAKIRGLYLAGKQTNPVY